MIIWLNKTERLKTNCERLNRIGYLEAKDYTVHRSFDHIAFSLFTGDVYVALNDQDEKIIIHEASCVLALPGDVRELIPLRPVNEFFFVYPAASLPCFFQEEENLRRRIPKVISLQNCPMVSEFANSMKQILGSPLSPARCHQLDLLAEVIMSESFMSAIDKPPHNSDKTIIKIENYIYRHYHGALDWEKIAGDHGISYPRFRQLWSRTHAVSPHAYVMELRNREACELLKDHYLPVARIAELCGYGDPRYFSRFFQRKNGMTPSEYRKKMREKEQEDNQTKTVVNESISSSTNCRET